MAHITILNLNLLLWCMLYSTELVTAGFLSKRNVQLKSFKYQPCEAASKRRYKAWAEDVVLMTTAEGDLDIIGRITTLVNITAPVQAKVKLKRSILGIYIPVPCIKEFGSCDYADLCTYGHADNAGCPALLEEHDVPCGCPIQQGSYELPGGQFRIPATRWAGVLAGKYKGTVDFYINSSMLACYDIIYELE